MDIRKYEETVYAGVLGKIIGVYLGRPVEGWPYQRIIDEFGEISYYKHQECNVPLIVADDDISGTFSFFRAIADTNSENHLTAADFGNAWLNYIIEDKTILWWGGPGRSTEHTAYLNLKRGVQAPESGSIDVNGRTLAEQIGAQIFMDAIAMACPSDPEKAVDLVRKAASVSHDGIALDAACYLGAMESMAFEEKCLEKLFDLGMRYVSDKTLLYLIDDIRTICGAVTDWRQARAKIDEKYGYDVYPGCCHIVPNHAMVLASLLLAGDNFERSIQIAASAAWDTDCNAGNVGCLNGIRLGLEGIDKKSDFRTPVADRMLVISSDGGSVISDAVIQTKKICIAMAKLFDKPFNPRTERFSFDYPGALQGFSVCPYNDAPNVPLRLINSDGGKLDICCYSVGGSVNADFSTPTWLDLSEIALNFSTVASPTLYETQTILWEMLYLDSQELKIAPYVLYYNRENVVSRIIGEAKHIKNGLNLFSWKVPSTEGMPIFRLGFRVSSFERFNGEISLLRLDWNGSPQFFRQSGMLMSSIWNTNPSWLQSWASSAKYFAADFKYTYCVSHPEGNGVVTIGTEDWCDYVVSSRLCFSLHQNGGLVARSTGHRMYYALVFSEYSKIKIICRRNDEIRCIAAANFDYVEDRLYSVCLRVAGNLIQAEIDGTMILSVQDDQYSKGGAGFLVERGTMTADGFSVKSEGVSE